MRDVSDDIKALRGRLGEAREYLRIDDLRARRPQLETEASRPDLWDDADVARKVTTEYNTVNADVELLTGLRQRLDDALNIRERLVARCPRIHIARRPCQVLHRPVEDCLLHHSRFCTLSETLRPIRETHEAHTCSRVPSVDALLAQVLAPK